MHDAVTHSAQVMPIRYALFISWGYPDCNNYSYELTDSSWLTVEYKLCDWTLDESDVVSDDDEVA